jgi:hypothetical protein
MSTSCHQIEIRQLHPLQVTGMVFYYLAPMATKSFSLSSPQSVQPPPSWYPPWKGKTIFYYRDRRGEVMAVAICAERGAMRGMERGRRSIVSKISHTVLHTDI